MKGPADRGSWLTCTWPASLCLLYATKCWGLQEGKLTTRRTLEMNIAKNLLQWCGVWWGCVSGHLGGAPWDSSSNYWWRRWCHQAIRGSKTIWIWELWRLSNFWQEIESNQPLMPYLWSMRGFCLYDMVQALINFISMWKSLSKEFEKG